MINKLKYLIKKYYEIFSYLFFGVLTTIFSIILYYIIVNLCKLTPLVGNIISWIIVVMFAFITNSIYVFKNKIIGVKDFTIKCIKFYSGRISTLILEEIILFIGINMLSINDMVVKIIGQIFVIAGNYIISKLFVFGKNKK